MKKSILISLFLIMSVIVIANQGISGKIYDNVNQLEKNTEIQSYLEKISNETGAIVVVILEKNIPGRNYNNWASETGKRMRLGQLGDPNKNVLIGYFKEEGIVYVVSKKGGKVSDSLKDEVSGMLKEAIDSKDDEKFLEAIKVLGRGLGVKDEVEKKYTPSKSGAIEIDLSIEAMRISYEKINTESLNKDEEVFIV